jgi:chondroitin 4-sulfotransferase 11
MIIHEKQLLFIHIPKTAGTSIESLFYPNAKFVNVPYKHFTLKEYLDHIPICRNYFKFTFVRNPWDLTASMYKYAWRKDDFSKTYPHLVNMSFNDWIRSSFFQSPVIRFVNIGTHGGRDGSFFDWFTDPRSEIDYIGKFETLQEDYDCICETMGLPKSILPVVNKSFGVDYADLYEEDTIEIVRKKYEREIRIFGYKFSS